MHDFWRFSSNVKRAFRRNELWDKLFASIHVCYAVKYLPFSPFFAMCCFVIKRNVRFLVKNCGENCLFDYHLEGTVFHNVVSNIEITWPFRSPGMLRSVTVCFFPQTYLLVLQPSSFRVQGGSSLEVLAISNRLIEHNITKKKPDSWGTVLWKRRV